MKSSKTKNAEPLSYIFSDGVVAEIGHDATYRALLHKVAGLSQQGDWEDAGLLAQEAILDGAVELRLLLTHYVACFLASEELDLGAFVGRVSSAMATVLDSAEPQVAAREVASPVRAALRDVSDLLRYRSTTKDSAWQSWVSKYRRNVWLSDVASIDELIEVTNVYLHGLHDDDDVQEEKNDVWQDLQLVLSKLRRWFAQTMTTLAPQVLGEVDTSIDSPPDMLAEAPERPLLDTSTQATGPVVRATPLVAQDAGARESGGGGPWSLLQRRIQAFSDLLAQGSHTRAAALAADIEQEIATFDPAHYFPDVFSRYYQALVRLRATEAVRSPMIDPDTGEYLRKYSRCDLEAFIRDTELDTQYEAA